MLSVNSELITQKDHTAALVSRDMGDDSDTVHIPPVLPLPQVYQSPSTTKFNVQHLSPCVAMSTSVPVDKDRIPDSYSILQHMPSSYSDENTTPGAHPSACPP